MPPDTHYFPSFDIERLTNSSKNNHEVEPRFHKLEETKIMSSIQFQGFTDTVETIKKELDEKKIAYGEGFKNGKIAGDKEKTNIVQNTLNHLNQAIEDLQVIEKQIHMEMERKIAKLSIAIAEKIIRQEVKMDEKIIVEVIKNAIKKFDRSAHIKIKISPNDYSILKKYYEEMSKLNKFEYILDTTISKGGFIIESMNGIIDASIEEQIDIITKTFESITSNSTQGLTI